MSEGGGLSNNDLVPRWPLYQLQHERGMVPSSVLVRVLTVADTAEGERVVQATAWVDLRWSREDSRSDLHYTQGRLVAELTKKMENEEMGRNDERVQR